MVVSKETLMGIELRVAKRGSSLGSTFYLNAAVPTVGRVNLDSQFCRGLGACRGSGELLKSEPQLVEQMVNAEVCLRGSLAITCY